MTCLICAHTSFSMFENSMGHINFASLNLTLDLCIWCNYLAFKHQYRKILKNSDIRKFAVITLKVEEGGFTLE